MKTAEQVINALDDIADIYQWDDGVAIVEDALHQARVEGVKLALKAARDAATMAVREYGPNHTVYVTNTLEALDAEDIIKGGQV